jgi:MFS transporter, DHA2 family, multidrug resistance protein
VPVGLRRWLIAISAVAGTDLYAITQTNVGIALPHMQGAFSAAPDQVAWLVTSFVVGTTIMTVLSGWLAARFGRRELFLCAILGFTIATVACGASTSLEEAVFWRTMQGVLGAPLLPLGQAITIDAFPQEQQGLATSFWAIGAMVGTIFGVLVGGLLVEHASWPWIFWVNVPIGILVLLGAWLFVPRVPRDPGRHLDVLGVLALVVGIGAVQLVFNRGERLDWFDSGEIAVEAAVAGLALFVFVVHSATTRRPFLPPALFANRNFLVGQAMIFIYGALVFLPLFILPLLLQQIGGYAETDIGRFLAPRGVGFVASLMIVGPLMSRLDPRLVYVAGLLALVASSWGLAFGTQAIDPWTVTWTSFVQGIGAGVSFVPVSVMAFATIEQRLRTEGLAVFHLILNLGTTVGVAAIFNVLARDMQANRAVLSHFINPYNKALGFGGASGLWDTGDRGGLAALNAEVGRQAAVIAYNDTFFLIGLVALAAMPLCLLLKPVRGGR